MAKNLSSKKKQVFSCKAPGAKSVKLVGDFTEWQQNAIALKKQKDGTWVVGVDLPAGSYQYRFLVDGEWRLDSKCPSQAPNPFGGQNCVCKVTGILQ